MNLSNKILLEWYQEIGINFFIKKITKNRLVVEKKNNIHFNNPENIKLLNKSEKLINDSKTIKKLKELTKTFVYKDNNNINSNNLAFYDGDPQSKIMIVGENMRNEQNKYNMPFCGKIGKLLDNILAAIKINRRNCYITDITFRYLYVDEKTNSSKVNIYKRLIEKHIALIKPKVLILIGNIAAKSLLDNIKHIDQIKNKNFKYRNRYLKTKINTFILPNLSLILKQPLQKKTMWLDIQKIIKFTKKLKICNQKQESVIKNI